MPYIIIYNNSTMPLHIRSNKWTQTINKVLYQATTAFSCWTMTGKPFTLCIINNPLSASSLSIFNTAPLIHYREEAHSVEEEPWEIIALCMAHTINALTCLLPFLHPVVLKLNGYSYQKHVHSRLQPNNDTCSCLYSMFYQFVSKKRALKPWVFHHRQTSMIL